MLTSNSEVETFLDCKRKWWFAYVLKLGTVGWESQPLAVGNLVHAGVENFRHVRYMQDGSKAEAVAAGIAGINALYDNTELSPELLPQDTIELALIMFEGWHEWLEEESVDFGLVYNGVEMELKTRIMPGVDWLAKLDAFVWNQVIEAFQVIDTKTVQSLKAFPALLQMDRQQIGYVWAAREYTQDRVQGAAFDMLRKVKRTARANPPFYGRVEASYNDTEIANWLFQTRAIIYDMIELRDELTTQGHTIVEQAQIATPRPSPDCTWKCPFVNVCPMMNDGSRAEDYINNEFVQVDPIARYLTIGEKP